MSIVESLCCFPLLALASVSDELFKLLIESKSVDDCKDVMGVSDFESSSTGGIGQSVLSIDELRLPKSIRSDS